MVSTNLLEKATAYVQKLCLDIPTRRVGSEGNQSATDFVTRAMSSFGLATESPRFECIDWISKGAQLKAGGTKYRVYASPYSLGCLASAPLVVASTLQELEALKAAEKVLLLRGELTKEQLMPKNFPFYNPEEHQRIIALLEEKAPRAIIAATSRDPAMAGGMYPFPLIEDGDFNIPSVYMTDIEGDALAQHASEEVVLDVQAQRIPSWGCNVIACKEGDPHHRVVFFAHIDAKASTPGALDNATGVVILLLLGELLADYSGNLSIELAAINGEDYYSAIGEKKYLRANENKFEEIVLGINMDGVGYYQADTAYSLYGCPPHITTAVEKTLAEREGMVAGDLWYQGDHSLFIMQQRPALALTSASLATIWSEIAHTDKDRPEIVDVGKLVEVAIALRELLLHLNQLPAK